MSTPSHSSKGRVGALVRSFAIQGSWNYRSLSGPGFAFALRPLVRQGEDGDETEVAVIERHLQRFNCHPYLVGVVLGAVARMEAERVDPKVIQAFKGAVQGSLGSLGDTLFWGAWRPATLLMALVVTALGAPPWVPVLLFLVIYNVGHVAVRLWSLRIGLEEGRNVATRLAEADLPGVAERVFAAGAVLLGMVVGLLWVGRLALVGPGWLWPLGGMVAFIVGLRLGRPVVRGATATLIVIIAVITAIGAI